MYVHILNLDLVELESQLGLKINDKEREIAAQQKSIVKLCNLHTYIDLAQ